MSRFHDASTEETATHQRPLRLGENRRLNKEARFSPRRKGRVCSLKALFEATRSNPKKSAPHKQIGASEASSLMDGQFHGWVSLTEMDQT
jgi:hypothetical protein